MTFLPIVERELRVMARQRSAYWMRFGAAALALALWLFVLLVSRSATVPQQAQAMFFSISITSLVFAMLAGVFLTADCLSEERREGTLGLLFLTELKGHDVVLGKLVSTSVLAFFCLLAVLPVLALPLLMGGMSGGEFWRTALVLLVTIFFSLSTAMLVSALSQDSRVAMLGSLLGIVLLAGLLPALWWMQHLVIRGQGLDFLLWPSPAYTFRRALDVYYFSRLGPGEFWVSLLTLSGLGFASLVTASVLLPRVWQEAPSAKAENGRAFGRAATRFGSPAEQMARCDLRDKRPYYWLATRDRLPKFWTGISLGLLFPVWLVFYFGMFIPPRRTGGELFGVAILISYGMHLIYKCLLAAEASRRLSDDRRSGALELLLATPLTPREIIRGQEDAVWDAFQWPRRQMVTMNLMLLWLMVGPNPMGMPAEAVLVYGLVVFGGIVLLYLDTFALARAGMWAALTTKRHTRAVLSALRRVMLLPWLAVLLVFFWGSLRMGLGARAAEVLTVLWFSLGIVLDMVVGMNAGSNLRNHFRSAAAGVYGRPILAVDGLPSLAVEPAEV